MPNLDATLAAIQMAIQTEIDGHNFYQKFAEQTQDPNARSMFQRLAREEIMHLEHADRRQWVARISEINQRMNDG